MAQVINCLPCNFEALSSNSSTAQVLQKKLKIARKKKSEYGKILSKFLS
jgi:hypothetical protein